MQRPAVEVEHRVGAPPSTVFSYFTDPAKYRRWQGVEAELDPRPGGIYRVMLGPQVWAQGTFVVVDPPRRIVVTWGFESTLDLPRGLVDVAPGSSTVEFTFVPAGSGTIVRLRHTGLPTPRADRAQRAGWDAYLPRLAAVLDVGAPGEDPFSSLGALYFEWDASDAVRPNA